MRVPAPRARRISRASPTRRAVIAIACGVVTLSLCDFEVTRSASAAFPQADAAASARTDAPRSPAANEATDARRARVALRIGSRSMTVGELEDRIATIPPAQLSMLLPPGKTQPSNAELIRAYIDQVVVRDMLLAAGAEQKKLETELPTSHQLERARSTATFRALKSTVAAPAMIEEGDVARYYEENRVYFDAPERINVWRILLKSKEDAQAVLDAAKSEPTIAKYNELARERSIDKATYLRGGNLGFLAPDGVSNQAGLKVDAAVIKAAQSVKDGEFVSQPVPEGENFAVVWRRGTVPPSKRSLDDASAQIRTTLFRQRSEQAEKRLIDDLRKAHLKNVDYGLLGIIELPAVDAGIGITRSIPQPKGKPSP